MMVSVRQTVVLGGEVMDAVDEVVNGVRDQDGGVR